MTATEPATAPPVTVALLRATLRQILQRRPPRDGESTAIALQAAPSWNGPEHLDLDDLRVRVVPCVSTLAVREALLAQEAGEHLAILTDRPEEDLGAGLLARLKAQRVFPLDPWEAVKARFGARSLDPLLVREEQWAAEPLLEAEPPEGWPPVAGGVLDRDTALRHLAGRLLGLDAGALDAAGLLQWSLDADAVARWRELPAELRAGLGRWLTGVAGQVAALVLAAVEAGHGTDAVALGLVCGALWQEGAGGDEIRDARVRLEAYVGGRRLGETEARRWALDASALVARRLDSGDWPEAILERAERLLAAVHAETAARHSSLLRSGLEARLRDFAAALRAALAGHAPAAALVARVEAALDQVEQHQLAERSARVPAARMAVRLLRWLAEPQAPAATLAALANEHVTATGWVDRARTAVWAGDRNPEIAAAYAALDQRVERRRSELDRRFAQLLADWVHAAAPAGSLLLVERVIEEVVAPLARQRPTLLIIVDAMSVAVAAQLADDLARRGWMEVAAGVPARRPVLAALPTVTEVCRCSLLAGALTVGDASAERAGFEAHPALAGLRSSLFHQRDLATQAGFTLPPAAWEAVADQGLRLVAFVLNSVDDALLKGDPGGGGWGVDNVRYLGPLLEAARTSGRAVVLTSDHGHVVERGSKLRPSSGEASRWRPADRPPDPDEVLLEGRRVLLGGGRVVVPWSERVRYAARRSGYHGGGSLAEAVIPLTVHVSAAADPPKGWEPVLQTAPRWWDGTTPPSVAAGMPAAEQEQPRAEAAGRRAGRVVQVPRDLPARIAAPGSGPARRVAEAPPTLFDQGHNDSRRGGPATPEQVVDALLASETFVAQRRRAARAQLDELRLRALLEALLRHAGALRHGALATAARIPPHQMRGTLTVLTKLLNVEGYPVLTVTEGETVRLDIPLLVRQFGLTEGGR
jgi:hypothetical protein